MLTLKILIYCSSVCIDSYSLTDHMQITCRHSPWYFYNWDYRYRVVFRELYQMIMKDVQIIRKFGKPLFSAKIAFFLVK